MKTIEIDDELYQYIASNTQHIGESASSILRRLLQLEGAAAVKTPSKPVSAPVEPIETSRSAPRAETVVEPAAAPEQKPEPIATDLAQVLQSISQNQQKAAVRRFLSLLGALYQLQPEPFSQVLEIRGRNRLYFALSEDELLQSGRSTNPMSIPGSPYWVIGNTNTERKREILSQVLQRLGYSEAQQSAACELL